MGYGGEKAQRCFQHELGLIKSEEIRKFVIECFDTVCPGYFWERAASSSGKYHPSFVAGDGGLVRHVKYAAYWADRFCRQLDGTGYKDETPNKDAVIAAILLHDCMKDGDPAKDALKRSYKEIGGCHGVDMAEAIWHRVLKGNKDAPKWAILILYGIAGHMSVWTAGDPDGKTKFPKYDKFKPGNLKGTLARKVAWIVAIADYAAAQRVEDVIPGIASFVVS